MSSASTSPTSSAIPLGRLRKRRLWNHLRHARYALRVLQAAASRREPLLIYTMGKVGSTSYHHALRGIERYSVFTTHFLNPAFRREYELGRGNLLKPPSIIRQIGDHMLYRIFFTRQRRRYLVITAVRDPVAQLISRFYHTASDCFEDTGAQAAELAAWFSNRMEFGFASDWFEREFREMTGLDVYAHPFDPARGWSTIENEELRCLILKLESPDSTKIDALRRFLDVADVPLRRRNARADRDQLGGYDVFKQNLRLSAESIDVLLQSRYVHHFYSEAEQAEMRARWLPSCFEYAGEVASAGVADH